MKQTFLCFLFICIIIKKAETQSLFDAFNSKNTNTDQNNYRFAQDQGNDKVK
jgi:hypothetical protein